MNEPVEVAGWLLPWWEFWHGITKALWWPAWSALFSIAALGATIYLATSNFRRERRRDAAFIEGVAITCDIILIGGKSALMLNGPMEGNWEERLRRVGRQLNKVNLFEQVHEVDLSKFSTSRSLRIFMDLRAVIATIADATVEGEKTTERQMVKLVIRGERQVQNLLVEARSLGGRTVSTATASHITKGAYKNKLALKNMDEPTRASPPAS